MVSDLFEANFTAEARRAQKGSTMAEAPRQENVHEHAKLSLKLALGHLDEIDKLAKSSGDDTRQILRELSRVVYRVGEAIIDQLAASSASKKTSA